MLTKRRNRPSIGGVEPLERRQLLAAAGAFDTSFSGDGKVLASPNLIAVDVAVQADGKTVVVGTETTPVSSDTAITVVRLNLDGSPDQSFGAAGIVRVQLGDLGESTAEAVAIAPDGKIVVVGTAKVSSGFDEREMAVARLNPDGALDPTFSGDGKFTIDLGSNGRDETYGRDVAVQPDGRIVVVGSTTRIPDVDFAIIRLNVNGSLDANVLSTTSPHTGFDGDGKRTVGLGGEDQAQAVKIDSNGFIYTVGDIERDNHTRVDVGLMKMTSAGTLVDSFDDNGMLAFRLPGRTKTFARDLLIQPGGKVVVAGYSQGPDGKNDIFVARYTAAGKLDTTFGGSGTGFIVKDLGGDDVIQGIVDSPVGSGFVVSGRSTGGMTLVKFTADGVVDTTFGTAGVRNLNFGGTANIVKGPGRRLTVAGGPSGATARLLEAGARVVFVAANSSTTEGSTTPAQIIVGRTERLTTPTRIYLNITGTAVGRQIDRTTVVDYTLDKIVQPVPIPGGDSRPYVDIPANETFVVVNLTSRNDTLVEGTETATFSVRPDPSYEIGTPDVGNVRILDDEAQTTEVAVSDDAYVKDGSAANTSFGSAADLQVKTAVANSGLNRLSYLKFNISSFGTIEQARLAIFGRLSDARNTNLVVDLYTVADTTWSGSTLNFTNKPAPATTPLTSATILDTALRRYEFNVGAYVKQQRLLGKTTVSFMLRSRSITDALVSFTSGNAPANQPKLVVVARTGSAFAFAKTSTSATGVRVNGEPDQIGSVLADTPATLL